MSGNRKNRQKCQLWGTLKTVGSHMFIDFVGVFHVILLVKTTLNTPHSILTLNIDAVVADASYYEMLG